MNESQASSKASGPTNLIPKSPCFATGHCIVAIQTQPQNCSEFQPNITPTSLQIRFNLTSNPRTSNQTPLIFLHDFMLRRAWLASRMSFSLSLRKKTKTRSPCEEIFEISFASLGNTQKTRRITQQRHVR
jgi:hypothetical protein